MFENVAKNSSAASFSVNYFNFLLQGIYSGQKCKKSAILEQFKFIVLPPNHGYKVIVVIRGGGLRSSIIMKKFIIKSLIFLAIEV